MCTETNAVITKDMLNTARMLPREQRASFLEALIEYGIEGKEPSNYEPWYPTFMMVKVIFDESRND